MAKRRHRLSRPLGILLSNLLVAIVLLLGVEAGTRLLGLDFPAVTRAASGERALWVYDASKGWYHTPGAAAFDDRGGPDRGGIRINALGLRGSEHSFAKAAGVRRLLVFGDSFVFGVGVDEPHLLTTRLQTLLTPDWEVVNMGVSGYSTDQELILFEELGQRLQPDLVLVVVCDNDFGENQQDFLYQRYYKPYFVLADGALSLRNVPVPRLARAQQARLWLAKESNVWNLLRGRRSSVPALQHLIDSLQVAVPRETADNGVALTFALLSRFRREVEGAGARFALANTGHRGEKTPLFYKLRRLLDPAGFHHVSIEATLDKLRADSPEELWDFPGDAHWNVDAHRVVAETIKLDLQRAGLLDRALPH